MTEIGDRTGNDLETAMIAARNDPLEADALLDQLSSHELYLAQDRDPRDLRSDEVLLPVVHRGGQKAVLAFTSKEHLIERGITRWIALRGCDLARLWESGAFLFLNPGTDSELAIPSEEVLELGTLREATPESMPLDTRIRVGEPAEEPRALLDAVARFARGHPEVVSAYRALVEPSESDIEAFPAIGLELEAGVDDQETLRLLAASVTPVVRGRVTFLTIRDGAEDPIAGYMLDESRPFYERDRRGGAVMPVLVVVAGNESVTQAPEH